MKKATMMQEKIRLEDRFFKKLLCTLLISVAVGLSPNVSFAQENLNARKATQNFKENKSKWAPGWRGGGGEAPPKNRF